MYNRKRNWIPTAIIGSLPIIWLAIKITPFADKGIVTILSQLESIFNQPFAFDWQGIKTVRTILVFMAVYAVALLLYLTTRHNFRYGEEHGSAKWGDVKNVNRKYHQKKNPNKILTQGVKLGYDTHKHRRNLNTVVIGGSGAGKSMFFAKPNILEASSSYFILDPKGELLRDTGHFLEEQGYDIKVLDLLDMNKSHSYNPFVYLRSDLDVQRLVTNLYANTTDKNSAKGEQYWELAGQELLMALVLYLWHEAPPEEQNFGMVLEMIDAMEVKEEDEDHVSPIDLLFERLKMRDPHHIALKYYRNFKKAAGKTAKSVLTTLLTHLDKFNLDDLVRLTLTDEMDLCSLGEQKTAIYAIIPDNDKSFNFIVGMMYTQLFQILYHQADKVHKGPLPVPVHIVMDEFANVALPDDFAALLSTMRSRNVLVSIIIQNLAQLKGLFNKQWEGILSNCDSLLYLGSNEPAVYEYISKRLGKETIDTNSFSKSRGKTGSYSTNSNIQARELLTPDEVGLLDNNYAILFIRGERPIVDLKYNVFRHPNIKHTPLAGGPAFSAGGDDQYINITLDVLALEESDIDMVSDTEYICLTSEELEQLLM